VIYGEKQPATLISLEPRELIKQLRKKAFHATLFEIACDGAKQRVLPRDVQFDPVTDVPIHVDFMRVGEHTRVHVDVPVVFMNELESPGLKRGGVLNVVRHEIELVCSVDHIPQQISIDLTGLDIGDSVHISMVKLPERVRPAIGRDFTIATIAVPTVQKVEAETAATPTEGDAAAAAAAPGAAAPAAAAGAGATAAAAGAKPAAGAAKPAAGGAKPAAEPKKK
jgi:large subunit ribosomal protein L25